MSGVLYHYTDRDGAIGIVQKGTIFKSTPQTAADAISGEGVYLTDRDPIGFTRIAIANDIFYDKTLPERMVEHGRINFAFKLKLRKSANLECVNHERHIWLYRDHDLELNGPDVLDVSLHEAGPD